MPTSQRVSIGPQRAGAKNRQQEPVLQRACTCGGMHAGTGACDACEKKEKGVAPSIVHDVLRTSGRPLDRVARASFETQFGYDFSGVRVHTDPQAAASARAVNALAYTVGGHVVFGHGQYSPGNVCGRALLAHELTHVVQQHAVSDAIPRRLAIDPDPAHERDAIAQSSLVSPNVSSRHADGMTALQRACLAPQDCPAGIGQGAKTQQTLDDPINVAKREKREKLCGRTPRDARCTSDGHARRAVELERLLTAYDRDRLTLIHGIFVDMDIPSTWGAVRRTCNRSLPPLDGDRSCIWVPDDLEKETKQFNTSQAPTIGTMDREDWYRLTLRKLMHETGHARFELLHPEAPRAGACSFDDIRAELHEIAADMDEIRTLYDVLNRSGLTSFERNAELGKVFADRWIRRALDNWKKIRCTCECGDANAFLRRTADTITLDWDHALLVLYHWTMASADPSWPIAPPPPAQGPGDFPIPRPGARRA